MIKKPQNKTLPSFHVEFDREEDGRWIAEIPKLPGVMAYGDTKQKAVRRVYAIALRTLADNIEQGNTPSAVFRLFGHEMARR
ncbi:MAG: type II toxin-antitoxin system HicB family antitoxin [Parcubacteria group bacterium]|nr:type II toxin-antitoxin system HicB family antitoxin [Parcubacteria group bacterium]